MCCLGMDVLLYHVIDNHGVCCIEHNACKSKVDCTHVLETHFTTDCLAITSTFHTTSQSCIFPECRCNTITFDLLLNTSSSNTYKRRMCTCKPGAHAVNTASVATRDYGTLPLILPPLSVYKARLCIYQAWLPLRWPVQHNVWQSGTTAHLVDLSMPT